jgi:hypothetical protein
MRKSNKRKNRRKHLRTRVVRLRRRTRKRKERLFVFLYKNNHQEHATTTTRLFRRRTRKCKERLIVFFLHKQPSRTRDNDDTTFLEHEAKYTIGVETFLFNQELASLTSQFSLTSSASCTNHSTDYDFTLPKPPPRQL